MFIPKAGTDSIHFADPARVAQGPLEVVFSDLPPYWHPPEHDEVAQRVAKEFFSPVDNPTGTGLDSFLADWNSSFHLGPARNLAAFNELCPVVKHVHNPNIAIAPRIFGYSELHSLLAALCSDSVLADHRLTRRPSSFLLSPISVARNAQETEDVFERRLRAEAEACSHAFRNYAWGRLRVRGRPRDYDRSSSLRVLFDDTPFWMNAAYRAATNRARNMLGAVRGILPAELMDHARMKERFGHVMTLPTLGVDERAQVRFVNQRIEYRVGRFSPGGGQSSDVDVWAGTGPLRISVGAGGNTLEECERKMRELRAYRFQPYSPDFVDTGIAVMPALREGDLWNLVDEAGRDEAFAEIVSPSAGDSIAPVLALLQREALPEDLRDKGWSYVKEDMHRRFYRKPRKGQRRTQIVCVETIDDFPVVDPGALLVEDDELLRSVMVVLDPREQKVIVLLRLGRTQNEIAKEVGLGSHSSVSRLVQKMKSRVRSVLGQPADARRPSGSQRRPGGAQ